MATMKRKKVRRKRMRSEMRRSDHGYSGASKNAFMMIISNIATVRSRHARIPKPPFTIIEAPDTHSSSCTFKVPGTI